MPDEPNTYSPNKQTGNYYYPGGVGFSDKPPKSVDVPSSQQGIANPYPQPVTQSTSNVQPVAPRTPYEQPSGFAFQKDHPEIGARASSPDPTLPPMAIGWKPKRNPNDPAETLEPDYGGNWWNAWLRKTVGTVWNPSTWGEGLDYEQKDAITRKHKETMKEYVQKNPWASSMEEYLYTMSLATSMGLQTIISPAPTTKGAAKIEEGLEIKPKFGQTLFRTGMLASRVVGKAILPAEWDTLWTLVMKGETPFRAGFAGDMSVTQVEDEVGVVTTKSLAERILKQKLPLETDKYPWAAKQWDFLPWENALRKGSMAYHYFMEGNYAKAAQLALDVSQPKPITGVLGEAMMEGGKAIGQLYGTQMLQAVGLEPNLSPLEKRLNEVTELNLAGSQAIYTFMLDGGRYDQYVQAVDGGMRPDLAAEMYMNPWMEMAGGMVFDVLNAAGAPGKFPKLKTATQELFKPIPEIEKALQQATKVAGSGADGQKAATAYKSIFQGVRTSMDNHLDRLVKWASDYTLISPVADAKYIYVTRRVNTMMELVARLSVHSGHSDDAAEFFSNFIKVAVGTEAEALAALPALHKNPFSSMAFSRAGMETMAFFKEMLTQVVTKGGKTVQQLDSRSLRALLDFVSENSSDSEKLIAGLTDLTNRSIKRMYPTMDEMEEAYKAYNSGVVKPTQRMTVLAQRYEHIQPLTRAINRFERRWAKPFYRGFNSIFAMVYMGLSPGYAVRNMLSNTVAYIADMSWGVAGEGILKGFGKGVSAQFFRPGATAMRKAGFIKDLYGFVPDFMLKGFGAAGGEKEATVLRKLSPMIKWAENMEVGMSAHIVEETVKRELGRALKHGALPGVDSLVKAGMSQANAELFFKMTVDNWGNTGKAIEQFMGAVEGKGVQTVLIDKWRHLPVPQRFQGFLSKLGLWDEFRSIRTTARNEQEFIDKFGDMWNQIRKKAGLGTIEHPSLPIDAPEAAWSAAEEELMQEMKMSSGTAEANEVFRQMYVAFRQARLTMDDGIGTVLSRLRDIHPFKVDWQALDAKMRLVKNETVTEELYAKKDALLAQTRSLYNQIKKKGDPKALWELVNFQGKTLGEMPASLDRSTFTDALWKFYRETTNEMWLNYNAKYEADMWDIGMGAIAEIEAKIGQPIMLLPRETEMLADAKRAFEQGRLFSKSMTWEQAKRAIRLATPEDLPATWFKEGVVPDAATIDDLHPFYLKAFGWDKGRKALINAVNYDRTLKGLAPVAQGEKVMFTEVLDALRRRVVQPDDLLPETLREITAKVGVLRQLNEADYTKVIDYVYRNASTKERKALKVLMSDLQEAGRTHANVGVKIDVADIWNDLEKVSGDVVKRVDTEAKRLTMPDNVRAERDALESALGKATTKEEAAVIAKQMKAIDDIYMPAMEGVNYSDANRLLQPVDEAKAMLHEKVVRDVDNMPSVERVILDQWEDFSRDTMRVLKGTVDQWGVRSKQIVDDNLRQAVNEWKRVADTRVNEAKELALIVAREQRDFILHPYWDKTYLDLGLAHIYPYQYWYNRTYLNFAQRLVFNPKIAAGYAKYRRAMERAHAGMPSWWKYNISTRDLPGMTTGDYFYDNPLYFNLEATFNPINGLTGVDFNDPNRRASWYASMVDDMGKYGASLFTPINWMVSAALWSEGETALRNGDLVTADKKKDAARRFLGRLFPQTATIETFLGWSGMELPWGGYEIDPFVRAMGGHDPYEERRIVRYLAGMDTFTPEQATDAAFTQKGQVWDDAVRGNLSSRFAGQMASFFLGVGFKPRTKEDMEIDAFYNEYFTILSMSDGMAPLEYQGAMEGLRQKYPFMDVVLLGRKSDYFRDGAYAYSILSRLPPGQMDEITEAVGITPELVDKFYQDKGLFDKWLPGDRDRFMAAVVDMAAVFSIPKYTTKMQWLEAKSHYYDLRDELKKTFGDDIWDKIDIYYELNAGGSYQEQQQAELYIQQHPEVAMALDHKTSIVVNDPILMTFYGGIDVLERYEMSNIYSVLDVKYPGVSKMWRQYYDLQQLDEVDGTKKAPKFLKSHPDMKKYSKEKKKMMENLDRSLEAFTSVMDRPELGVLRADWGMEVANQTQRQVASIVNPPPALTWEDYSQPGSVSVPIQRVIIDYYLNGVPLPYSTGNELDWLAPQFGFANGDDMLRDMGRAIRQENQNYLRLLVPEQ